MNVDLGVILDVVQKGGMVGLLLAILVGGMKRWWVFGWVYEDKDKQLVEKQRESDMYRELAFRGTQLAEITTKRSLENK
jgi:hypothetical protein